MKQRHHTPEQIVRKLAEGDKLLAEGKIDRRGRAGPRDLRVRPSTVGAINTAA